MVIAGDRLSRGARVQEIQELNGFGAGPKADNVGFQKRLNEVAAELGVADQSKWIGTKLSKVRNGTQDLSIEDMTVIARLDPKQRGWTWVAYGAAIKKGEDAWAVLERMAKRSRTA